MRFNGDFSTGDDSQWRDTGPNGGTQDSGSNEDTDNCWFGPLNFLKDQSDRPGWWGQFNVPAAPTKQRCQVITHATPVRETDDYISLRLHTPPGWSDGSPAWPVQIIEPNFQGLGPNGVNQFTLALKPTGLTVDIHAGEATDDGHPYWYECTSADLSPMNVIPGFQSGIAYELVVHVRWRFDSTGRVKCWFRELAGEDEWEQSVEEEGFPTLQHYEDGGYKDTNMGDVMQLYRGSATAACKLSMNGYAIHDSFQEAAAFLV